MVQPMWKVRPWRSRRYLDFVKSLRCCVPFCNCPADDPHHEEREANKGMSTRACDSRAVPLCRHHHNERQHGKLGRGIWAKWGVGPEEIITRTQAEWVRRGGKREWEME